MFLAAEMVALQVAPDTLTYDRLVLVCLNTDRAGVEDAYEDAWRYFEEMKAVKWWPRAGTIRELAMSCCEKGDERVWRLAEEETNSELAEIKVVDKVIAQYWKAGENHGKGREEDGNVDKRKISLGH